jgi:hypothetical protein
MKKLKLNFDNPSDSFSESIGITTEDITVLNIKLSTLLLDSAIRSITKANLAELLNKEFSKEELVIILATYIAKQCEE